MLRGFGGGAFSPDEDGVPAIGRKPASPAGWQPWKAGPGMLAPVWGGGAKPPAPRGMIGPMPEPTKPPPEPFKAGPGMLRNFSAEPFTGMTPDDVKNRRQMAGGMITAGMSAAPVQHWTQGVARALQGLSGNMWMDEANQAEKTGMQAGNDALVRALNGGSPKQAAADMMRNSWSAEQGQKLANGMLAQDIENASPDAQLARDYKRAQIRKMDREATGPNGGEAPSNVREWQHFNSLSPEDQQRYLTMKRAEKWLDRGTEFVAPNPVDPTAPPRVLEKNTDEAKYRDTLAKMRAEAAGNLPTAEMASQRALDTIEALRSHPGREWGLGAAGILPGIAGTDQKAFVNLVDQAKGQAFLEAFNSLRGGGQITEAEGRKATDALARLDRAQRPEDFDAALKDYEDVIKKGLDASRQRAGANSGNPPPPNGGRPDPLGLFGGD